MIRMEPGTKQNNLATEFLLLFQRNEAQCYSTSIGILLPFQKNPKNFHKLLFCRIAPKKIRKFQNTLKSEGLDAHFFKTTIPKNIQPSPLAVIFFY